MASIFMAAVLAPRTILLGVQDFSMENPPRRGKMPLRLHILADAHNRDRDRQGNLPAPVFFCTATVRQLPPPQRLVTGSNFFLQF
jgi:hypothetical protein